MDTAPGPAMICTMYLNKMELKWRLISPTLRLSSIIKDGVFLGLSVIQRMAMHRITQPLYRFALYVMQSAMQRIAVHSKGWRLPCWILLDPLWILLSSFKSSWMSSGGISKNEIKKWNALSTSPFAAIRERNCTRAKKKVYHQLIRSNQKLSVSKADSIKLFKGVQMVYLLQI